MKTFHNLQGIVAVETLKNSDNEIIEGTEKEKIILYNTGLYSAENILEKDGDELYELERKGKILIIDRHIAEQLADVQELER